MKLFKTAAIVLGFATMTSIGFSQQIKVTQGSLAPLAAENSFYTQLTFDGLQIADRKGNLSEAEFIKKRKDEYEKKETGKGEKWAAAWENDKTDRYKVKFNQLIADETGKTLDPKAKYTIIYNTTFLEPGYNIGISRKDALHDAEATVVETANPSNVIAKLTIRKAHGRMVFGMDLDNGARISETYADAAKELGQMIRKAK